MHIKVLFHFDSWSVLRILRVFLVITFEFLIIYNMDQIILPKNDDII